MNKKVFSAAILASAAMAMTSCSSSKNAQNENATKAEKITEAEAARPSADEEMDESYLILSEAQQNIVKKNNDFAFKLYQQIGGMDSEVVSPMSIAYLMGMLANGADGMTQQEILKAIGCAGVSVKELNDCYKAQTAAAICISTSIRATRKSSISTAPTTRAIAAPANPPTTSG